MKEDIKYAGIDLHQSTCAIEIENDCGQTVSQSVVKTEAETLRSFFQGMEGAIHVAFEVGTQSAWLYEILKPVVTSITVCDVRKNKRRGSKNDRMSLQRTATAPRLVLPLATRFTCSHAM